MRPLTLSERRGYYQKQTLFRLSQLFTQSTSSYVLKKNLHPPRRDPRIDPNWNIATIKPCSGWKRQGYRHKQKGCLFWCYGTTLRQGIIAKSRSLVLVSHEALRQKKEELTIWLSESAPLPEPHLPADLPSSEPQKPESFPDESNEWLLNSSAAISSSPLWLLLYSSLKTSLKPSISITPLIALIKRHRETALNGVPYPFSYVCYSKYVAR